MVDDVIIIAIHWKYECLTPYPKAYEIVDALKGALA